MACLMITNNQLVSSSFEGQLPITFLTDSYLDVFYCVRDLVHKGHVLLTHPLSGSIKPDQTPYKSVLVSETANATLDFESLELIEHCIETAKKFPLSNQVLSEKVLADFRLVDYYLIETSAKTECKSSS